jgi:hypothetical protein
MNDYRQKLKSILLLAVGVLALGGGLVAGWGGLSLDAQTSPVVTPGAQITATPDRRTVNEITHPRPGDAVAGFADIIGSALITDFQRYDVHIALAGSEDWRWLTTDYRIVRNGTLYTLDTTRYPDGLYDLRVRALNQRGEYTEAFLRNLKIRNAYPPTPTPVVNAAGLRVYIVPTLVPTPRPTPTPANETRVEGGQGFYAPRGGDQLSGYVNIVATVNGFPSNPFDRYELAISPAGLARWSHLYTGDQQAWQDSIYLLDTRRFPDGLYDLRLRIVYRDANYNEYFLRNLHFANQGAFTAPLFGRQGNGIFSPRAGAQVQGRVDFLGTAADSDFLRWELYWSPAGAEEWAFAVSRDKPVFAGKLATLDLTKLPPGAYDFRLRVVRRDFNYDEYFLRGLTVVDP